MVADQQIGTMLLVVFATSIPSAASLKTQTFTNTPQAAGSGASCTLADTSGCQDKDVILYNPVTNGDGSVQGLVLTFWGGQWGTVCDDVTDCDAPGGGTSPCSNGYVNVAGGQQLAAVVCRELGLDASGAQEYNANGGSSGYPIHVDGTSNHISGCAGTEAALADCAWLLYGSHNCGHHEDVGVICQPASPTSSPTPSPTPAPTSPPTPPPTPAPTTAPANLALECPAQQGPGQWNGFGASLCVDGSTRDDSSPLIPCTGSVPYTQGGACQSVCHTDYGANPWFEVTLAGAATIDSVKVVNAWTHCCKERIAPFYMRLLDSAGSEISSKRFSSTQDEYEWTGVGVSGVSRVKIEVDKASYLHMAELFVYGTGVNSCGGPPTPPPTAATPSPAAGGAASASAIGDPHLTNVYGQKFDLMKLGKHVLINIPRGEPAESAFLRVQALAQRLGDQCGDVYFQEVNVTGSWAEAKQAGGYHYSISQSVAESPEWVAFGEVELKVVQGRTHVGTKYFNVYVKRLGRAGFAVGGLLGEDDHTDATQVPASCHRQVALVDGNTDAQDSLSITLSSASSSFASFASASLE